MYWKSMNIKLYTIMYFELLLIFISFMYTDTILSVNIFILSLVSFIITWIYFLYLNSIYSKHSEYINEIINYKEGYITYIRFPKDMYEDKIFRKFANKSMIKELDNYLEFNKKVRIKYLSKKNKGIITDWEGINS